MDASEFRDQFPGTAGRAFLDAAAVSLLPTPAADAVKRLAEDLLAGPARDSASHHIALDMTSRKPREEAAKLINATHADISLVESTSHALQMAAASVPLGPGDRVLVGETEFLGLAVPWIGRRKAQGFTIDVVPHRDGRLVAEDFERAMDGRVRLVLLSSVQWSNGFRADLASFCGLCRRKGVTLVLDVIQGLGAVPLDLKETPCGFAVCGGHKWLNCPVGRGFLYVSPEWQRRAEPPRGYLHIRTPPRGWAEYFATPDTPAVRDYEYRPDARAFEVGGFSSYASNAALGECLALFNLAGPAAIWEHVFRLGELLAQRLERAGVKVISHRGEAERSGIISFTLGQGVEKDQAFLAHCWDRRVVISHRYTANVGGLRASVHYFNDERDIDALVDAVASFGRGMVVE
jgi:selenocysteine lyase/cysteine desulfurase